VVSLHDFRQALEQLAADARLNGIVLEVETGGLAAAKLDALRKLLLDFRARGKRVVGWAVGLDNTGYQLLCAADEILLSPAGKLELMGLSAEAMALGEGLNRWGIKAEFIRRGPYKTAPELF